MKSSQGLSHMKKGFSMLELSIVLIVIAVLVGGIIGGRELLAASRMNAAMSLMLEYESAIEKFREKYKAIPGDMDDANAVLGGVINGHDNGTVLNGNGNGWLDSEWNDIDAEEVAAWDQLSSARYIEGRYGKADTIIPLTPGKEIPHGPYTNSGFRIFNAGANNGAYAPLNWNRDEIAISLGTPDVENFQRGGVMTPAEGYQLDKKYDDGYPARGRFQMDEFVPDMSNGSPDVCYAMGSVHMEYKLSYEGRCAVLWIVKDE